MDRIKEKLTHIRAEADEAIDRATVAEAKNKKLEHELTIKEAELHSLTQRSQKLEDDLDGAMERAKIAEDKLRKADVEIEDLRRKVVRLETERDEWEEKHAKEVEKNKGLQKQMDELLNEMDSI